MHESSDEPRDGTNDDGTAKGQSAESGSGRPRERSGKTRRRILQATGGVAAAGVLGVGGWIRRTEYLNAVRDRTDLVTRSSPTRSRVGGPRSGAIPADALLAELDRFSERRSETGLQAAVVFDDGTAWRGVAGRADHDDGDPLTLDYHLYVGSVTKFFTATLVMRQVQQGNVSLSDTIDEWFDLEYADDVTVRMLLNHTSGVPNYTGDLWFTTRNVVRPAKRWRPAELVDIIRGNSLDFEPGSRHLYSNSNYVLLGILLEQLTGSSYAALVGDCVRADLGYDRTYYRDYSDDVPIANAYDESVFNLGRRELTVFRTTLETSAFAAGGILSTAPNLAGFVRSVFTGRALDEDVLSEMRTFVDAPDEDVTTQVEYGLGIRHLRIDDEDLYGHTGTIPGYSSIAMHHDQPTYTIAVIGNVSTIDQAGICGALQRVVLEGFY